ncbi:MAG: Asp-tRNA(Asn)/Glu-tRNA(Gln) amidotransferase subunit GatC [Tatlockia sp.]|nr:Asp-tRNA(Asn)/Glu-tRNA(Gln) amidotransferase subunit GatC [Tatlockia sp.]
MPALNEKDLEKIALLAYLDCGSDNHQLAADLNSIMNFVEQLRKIDTTQVAPLFHPLDLSQRLRADEITEKDCSAELAKIAPSFEDGYYQVPKVIDSGQ